MTRFSTLLTITAAVVLLGLGVFFWLDNGKKQFRAGYVQCQADGAALATEAGRRLQDEMQKFYTPTETDRLLLIGDGVVSWLHNEAAR
jgi:hypothetical protein